MANKALKFLFYINCLLLLLVIGIFFGLYFQSQSAYAVTNETYTTILSQQDSDIRLTNNIFENYTQTSLREEYNDKTILDQLKESNEITTDEYERAIDVLNGNTKFTSKREFSTKFENDNKIDQVGDIAKYSQNELNCIWPASEIILTGIYGMPDYIFNVFVEANETTNDLPYILFSQNHGYYSHWFEKYQLKKGWNKLIFPTFGLKLVEDNEIIGGAVYLCNPYVPEEQGEVNVYIEGGDYYPIFRKGGNEKEFLNFLKEYETMRKSKNLLDMAELVTDHAIISTTSSSLYDVYFNNNVITPSENLNLWGNYFTTIFELNGIPTSDNSNLDVPYDKRNDYVKINFRYMTYYQGSGAYSYSYHIGWYYEHYWFANFYNALSPIKDHKLSEHLIFGVGHELGHALDNEPRKINETTNNFTAAMAYFKIVGMPHYEQYQPFEKTFKALSNDYMLNYKAYDDGQIMYTKKDYPSNYDHNYLIWWDLEAVFPGFWARFNNYFRKPLKAGLTTTELYVYYSSLATGVDLSNYYERWGFYYGKSSNVSGRFIYTKSSNEFKEAMQEALDKQQISKHYDHFWYVDDAQYNFMLAHENVAQEDRVYKNGKPTITKILHSNNEHTIFINSNKDAYHLGYEVLSKINDEDWKIVGFTYTSTFVDQHYYTSTPTYKVLAVNRFFETSDESDPESKVVVASPYVCKVNDVFYDDLSTAITNAENNSTIFLLNDCTMNSKYIVKNLTLQIDDSVNNDIYIYSSGTTSMFVVQSYFSIIGKDNAKIIFDGSNCKAGNPAIYGTSDKIIIKNAIFRNFNTIFLAGAVYSMGSDLEIYNTSFDACNSAKNDAAIYASKTLKLDNCTFSNNLLDVYVSNLENLMFGNQFSKLTLGFNEFEGEKTIIVEENAREIAEKIEIKTNGYTTIISENQIIVKPLSFHLKFHFKSYSFEYFTNDITFIFGDEDFAYNLMENQYVEYEERTSGKKYKTGDKIIIDKNMEFDTEIKDKLFLKIFYKNDQNLTYYAYQEEVYLPTIDKMQNKVFAYKDGDIIYNSGQIYTLESNSILVAIYLGNLTYRYIVKDEVYSVGYGNYGQNIELLELKEEGFRGWKSNTQIVSDNVILKNDVDFIALFKEEQSNIYDLDKCEIHIIGTYSYCGSDIQPEIVVYFNGLVVPENCYSIYYSNNISASTQAMVTITAVDSLSMGSKTQMFTIHPKQLEENDVNITGLQNFVYNGTQTKQSLLFSYEDKNIETFSIQYIGDRINAGNVQIKITFFGNYAGDIDLEYTILKAERENFKVLIEDWVYGQSGASPRVENVGEQAIVSYSYSTEENGNFVSSKPTKAGTYWVKAVIEQSRNYNSAEDKVSFIIVKADHPVQMPDKTMIISRKTKTLQDVILTDAGWQWETPNTQISAEITTAWVIYIDTENYEHYRIEITLIKEDPKDVSKLSVNLEVKTFVYNGTERTPKVIAKDGDITLTSGIDYDVQYQNNKNAGQGKVIVTFKNDYTGSIILAFAISQAEKPSVDNTTILVNHKVAKLSDIQLSNGFVWENENMEITSNRMTAKGIYVGDDADNYVTKEIYFEIIIDMPQNEPKTNSLIWLAIVVPVGILLVACSVYAIVRCKRKNS